MNQITVFIVDKDSPALTLLKRGLLKAPLKPGQVILATTEELKAWKDDVVTVDLFAPPPGPPTLPASERPE